MEQADILRKRATVMIADVVGYSTLMGDDDVATLRDLLDSVRSMAALVQAFGGDIVDASGDSVMAEFAGESWALRCALRIQAKMRDRNRSRPEHRRMRFRIGIHSGEVLERHGRLYGNVVNVAARLQAASTAGGVLVSDSLAERVDRTLLSAFASSEARQFKNIRYAMETHQARI